MFDASAQAAEAAARVSLGLVLVVLVTSLAGCAGRPLPGDSSAPLSVESVAVELEAMTGPVIAKHRDTFRSILAASIDKDFYVCMPSPREVFAGDAPEGERTFRGSMPHYGFFYGPMHYVVRRRDGRWGVEVRLAVHPPREDAWLELPDCGLKGELGEQLECSGTPYSLAGTTDACPGSGVFRTRATRPAVRALLARWSREVEGYYNRDAAELGLPVEYDFDFVTVEEAEARGLRVDMELPLAPTCGRTPYFSSMRSGWSLPILAHEVGHFLGLLDEYEALSGLVGFYPKTPFRGAEVSRMGLSMKETTKVLPMHHYLVLRRYFCPEPRRTDPYAHVL